MFLVEMESSSFVLLLVGSTLWSSDQLTYMPLPNTDLRKTKRCSWRSGQHGSAHTLSASLPSLVESFSYRASKFLRC